MKPGTKITIIKKQQPAALMKAPRAAKPEIDPREAYVAYMFAPGFDAVLGGIPSRTEQ